MNARQRILARLKASAPAAAGAAPDVAGWYAGRRASENRADKIRRFRQCIESAHAEVHPASPDDWPQKLWEVLHARRIDKLLLAPATPHGARARAELTALGVACPGYEQPIETWKAALFDATPASLTAARSAIAETGTLILWPDADEPRLMSLAPPLHIVLLDAARIHDDFFAAMRDEAWQDGLPTNALLISGPSKTADIQQTLAYGAHGPKELVVLLVEDAS